MTKKYLQIFVTSICQYLSPQSNRRGQETVTTSQDWPTTQIRDNPSTLIKHPHPSHQVQKSNESLDEMEKSYLPHLSTNLNTSLSTNLNTNLSNNLNTSLSTNLSQNLSTEHLSSGNPRNIFSTVRRQETSSRSKLLGGCENPLDSATRESTL